MREVDGRYGRVPECSENGVSLSVSLVAVCLSLSLCMEFGPLGAWCRVIGCDWMECWS